MKAFKLHPLAAVMSSMVAVGAHSVLAQDINLDDLDAQLDLEQEPPQVEARVTEEEVMVTGFRRSLQNSIDSKRNADTIVESISAEDIGGLPDTSIADALARQPGITTDRTGGQAGSIQIRGLSGEFVFSTLNGREQVSPNRGRTVEFNQYPAELLSEVAIYKTPKASLIEGGVAGTVELKTANPLEMSEDHKFSVNARGSYNDRAGDVTGAEEYGSRFSASYQGKFFDETLGLAVGYARLEQGNVDEFYSGLAWTSINDSEYVDLDGDGNPNAISDGFEFSHRGGNEIRDGFMTSVQFEPNENLTIQADYYFSKFESEQFQRGFLWQDISRFELDNLVIAPNGIDVIGGQATVLAATRLGGPSTHSASAFSTDQGFQTVTTDRTDDDEVQSGGILIKWVEDRWELGIDFSRSEAEGFHADGFARAHLYDGDPSTRTAVPLYDASGEPVQQTDDEGNLVVDEQGSPVFVQATDANGNPLWEYQRANNLSVSWLNQAGELPRISTNADFTNINPANGDFMRLSTYERYPHVNTDEVDAVKIDGKINFDDFFIASVEAGARYSERHYIRGRRTFVYSSFGGRGDNNLRSVSLDLSESNTEVVNWTGQFSHFPNFLAIDADGVFAQAIDDGLVLNNDGTTRDPTPRARWGEGRPWSMTQRADVTEEVLAYYLMANIDTEIAERSLTGNIGFRVVETDQSSIGIRVADPLNGVPSDDIRDGLGRLPEDEGEAPRAFFTDGETYTDILPSLNLSFSITENDIIRLAAAKVISRADIDDLANDASLNVTRDEQLQRITISYEADNNPFLRPFEANQVDLSYEHYFEDIEGYFALAIFNKDIVNRQQTVSIDPFNFRENDFLPIEIPENLTLAPEREDGEIISRGGTFDVEDEGSLSLSRNNDAGGYIRGLEISGSYTFSSLPEPFDTLGFVANYAFIDSEITEPDPFTGADGLSIPLPGLAENSGSVTLFWQWEGLELRGSANYQDEKVGELFDPTGNDGNLTFFEAQTVVDLQASYEMENGLKFLFQVNNATDEPNKAFQGESIRTDQIQYFGRQYFLGVNYTFGI